MGMEILEMVSGIAEEIYHVKLSNTWPTILIRKRTARERVCLALPDLNSAPTFSWEGLGSCFSDSLSDPLVWWGELEGGGLGCRAIIMSWRSCHQTSGWVWKWVRTSRSSSLGSAKRTAGRWGSGTNVGPVTLCEALECSMATPGEKNELQDRPCAGHYFQMS